MTIFDKIIAGDIPAEKVYEDDDVLAFHDIKPVAPVHVLVIPKHKLTGFAELKDQAQVAGVLFSKAAMIADKLGVEQDGYRIVVNHGDHGCQTVSYIHVHILAGRQLQWPPG